MKFTSPTHQGTENWSGILWREWRYCEDSEYAEYLHRLLSAEPLNWIQSVGFNLSTRPYTTEVEAALRTACQIHGGIKHLWEKRLAQLERAKKKLAPLPKLILNLQDHHWFERFIARHVLAYRGGEAVTPLVILFQTGVPEIRPIAHWLLESIGQETEARLAKEADTLLCSDCVVHCYRFEIELPEQKPIAYYGCRLCHQSLDFDIWPGGVVAVLDRTSHKAKIQANDHIRVNWLRHRTLFDFDRVEIIQATDEEVERFTLQVGNDTDQLRASRYQEMGCTLSPNCKLSENTIRILEHVFGYVK